MNEPAAAAVPLTSKQRKFLRGLAHPLRPVLHVGQSGLTGAVVAAVGRALLDHELIKVRFLDPEDKRTMAELLAEETGSALCGLVGHTAILYRAHPAKPTIELPG